MIELEPVLTRVDDTLSLSFDPDLLSIVSESGDNVFTAVEDSPLLESISDGDVFETSVILAFLIGVPIAARGSNPIFFA